MYAKVPVSPIRSIRQQEDNLNTLEHLNIIHNNAVEAVALGDGTLKEANNTYHTLAEFRNLVDESSKSATIALETVPQIQAQIQEAERTVYEAERVSKSILFLFITNKNLCIYLIHFTGTRRS